MSPFARAVRHGVLVVHMTLALEANLCRGSLAGVRCQLFNTPVSSNFSGKSGKRFDVASQGEARFPAE